MNKNLYLTVYLYVSPVDTITFEKVCESFDRCLQYIKCSFEIAIKSEIFISIKKFAKQNHIS